MFGLGVVLVALLLAPASSTAVDSDLKFAYAFKVQASNGFEILAFAANERADGRGGIAMIVSRGGENATYTAPARLTASTLRADLGPLGKIDLDVSPSGREKRVQANCGGEAEAFEYEPLRYTGTFEFHGEEGYSDAATANPREFDRFLYLIACPAAGGGGEGIGFGFPGARLKLYERDGDFRLDLQVHKNRPGKPTHFEVEAHEVRGKIRISRSTDVWLGPNAFRFDRALDAATLDPPAPFAGEGRFTRGPSRKGIWDGDLTVDLPGRSDVPLTGTGTWATLVHACRHDTGGSHRC